MIAALRNSRLLYRGRSGAVRDPPLGGAHDPSPMRGLFTGPPRRRPHTPSLRLEKPRHHQREHGARTYCRTVRRARRLRSLWRSASRHATPFPNPLFPPPPTLSGAGKGAPPIHSRARRPRPSGSKLPSSEPQPLSPPGPPCPRPQKAFMFSFRFALARAE